MIETKQNIKALKSSMLDSCQKILVWICFTCLLSLQSSAYRPVYRAQKSLKQKLVVRQKLQSASSRGDVVLIDVENVRGKSGFELSHSNILQTTSIWAKHYGFDHRTSLIVDHGSYPSAYYLENEGISVVFAGRRLKADDVIVRDIRFFQQQQQRTTLECESLVIVTADMELMRRCKSASTRRLTVIDPISFLDDLEYVIDKHSNDALDDIVLGSVSNITNQPNGLKAEEEVNDENINDPNVDHANDEMVKDMELQIHLGAKYINAVSQLKRKMSPKKRKKLQHEANKIRAQLGKMGPSALERVTSILSNYDIEKGPKLLNLNLGGDGKLNPTQQKALLDKWEYIRKSSGRKEVTGDRIILAERLRRELEEEINNRNGNDENDAMEKKSHTNGISLEKDAACTNLKINPSEAHVQYVNSLIIDIQNSQIQSTTSLKEKTLVNKKIEISSKPQIITPKSEVDVKNEQVVLTTNINDENGQTREENNSQIHVEENENATVRFVVISDTHGYERSLTRDDFLKPWIFHHENKKSEDSKSPLNSQEDKTHNSNKISTQTQNDGFIPLPDGDVLLHLGDFAIDRAGPEKQKAHDEFDEWLSKQPHPTKIVVRGNHDPFRLDFPLSKATYVTKPKSIDIPAVYDRADNGTLTNSTQTPTLKLVVVPYGGFPAKYKNKRSNSSAGKRKKNILPSWCDVLASHVPPRGILDTTYSGENAGSPAIRQAVEKMEGDPPKFWFCGHIHESHGYHRTTFGMNRHRKTRIVDGKLRSRRETVVINAANANSGRANCLVHGPVVVDIPTNREVDELIENPTETTSINTTSWNLLPSTLLDSTEPILPKRKAANGERELLLAIDLGLRCGAALYDDTGTLVRYEQLKFKDTNDLRYRAPQLIESWEEDLNVRRQEFERDYGSTTNKENEKWRISYLALEGGYGEMWDAWSLATTRQPILNGDTSERKVDQDWSIEMINIRPEEWRSHLLTPLEMSSSRKAKEAARLIARQIVGNYGEMGNHEGKFKTDSAESVLLGFFVANHHLRWITAQDDGALIQRYMNGKIIVP